MGIFDQLTNLNPDQTQGLLAAASQLLQASGPSRTPTSFGQILGGGIGAYQQGMDAAQKRRQDQQQAEIMQKLMGYKLKDAESDYNTQELSRAEALRAQQVLGGLYSPQSPTANAASVLGQNMAPTAENAAALAAAPPQQAAAQSDYARLRAEAQALRGAGLFKAADAKDLEAIKFKPEYSQTPQMGVVDGKPTLFVLDKDGNPKYLNGVLPKPTIRELNLGGTTQLIDDNTVTPGQTYTRTQSPDSAASNALGWSRFRWDQEQAKADDGTGPLSQEAIKNAAERYNFDGTLPALGMGKGGAAGRSAILNVAAGLPSASSRDTQLANKGDIASQSQAVKQFTSGKLGNTVRSFNVGISHLDTLGQLADALNNRDVPALNKIGNYYAQQSGNPAPTSFNAAKKIVGDEIVKAIVGAGGGVKDREEAANTIDAANSPAQLKSVIKTYQELMVGQLGGLEQQYRTSTKKNDFSNLLSDRAKEIYSASHGSAPTQSTDKVATLADIAETARKSGRSTAEVTAALRAKGYKIGGQ